MKRSGCFKLKIVILTVCYSLVFMNITHSMHPPDESQNGNCDLGNKSVNIIKAVVEGFFQLGVTQYYSANNRRTHSEDVNTSDVKERISEGTLVRPPYKTLKAEGITNVPTHKAMPENEELNTPVQTFEATLGNEDITPSLPPETTAEAEEIIPPTQDIEEVTDQYRPFSAPEVGGVVTTAAVVNEPDFETVVLNVSFEAAQFINEVQNIVNKAYKKYPLKNKYGLYVKEFKTGYEYGVNEKLTHFDESDKNNDGYFRAASVVKLQMAYVAYRLIERGELLPDKTWHDPVTDKELSLLPCLHTMVSRSDNNLFNTMLRLIGRKKVNETLIEFGIMNSTVYGEINPSVGYSEANNLKRHGTTKIGGKITPKDMGLILEAIYLEKDSNEYMKCFNEALLSNIYDSRIPRGIEKKYPVAHKTGTSDGFGVYNDAGIVYCKNPYILVVLTKGEASSQAQGFIREMAKLLTDYMDTRV